MLPTASGHRQQVVKEQREAEREQEQEQKGGAAAGHDQRDNSSSTTRAMSRLDGIHEDDCDDASDGLLEADGHHSAVKRVRQTLEKERKAIEHERCGMRQEREAIRREREAIHQEREAIARERERLDLGWEMIEKGKAIVVQELRGAAEEREAWQLKREHLKRRKDDIKQREADLEREVLTLEERERELEQERESRQAAATAKKRRPSTGDDEGCSGGGGGSGSGGAVDGVAHYQQAVEVARLRVELEMQREQIGNIRQAWEYSLAEAEKSRAEAEHIRCEWERERERQLQERREFEQQGRQAGPKVLTWSTQSVLPHLRDLPGIGRSPAAAAAAAATTTTTTQLSPMVSLAGGQQAATHMHHSSPEPRYHIIDSPLQFDMFYRHYANPRHQHSHQPQPQSQSAHANVAYLKQWAQQRVPESGASEDEPGEGGGKVGEEKLKKKQNTTQDSPEWLSSSDESEYGGSSETSQSSLKRKRQRRDVPSSDLYGPSNIRTRKTWEERFEDLKRYKRQHGHLAIPYTEKGTLKQLYEWMCSQRKNHRNHALNRERFEKLDALGFPWTVKRDTLIKPLPSLPPIGISDSKHSAAAPVPTGQLPSIATTLQEALDQVSRSTHEGYRNSYATKQQE